MHLRRRFGISLKLRQAQIWMHQHGYRMKRASHAYLQARSQEARRFQRALKKLRTLKPNETVVFQDEAGFTLHPRLGFGWSRRGQRLRVPTTSQHNTRLNLSGWVAPLLCRYGMIRTEKGNREGFLEVLSQLYRRLWRYRITLYVDGAGWHKGAPMQQLLRTHPRLRLHYLPSYQPALNLQEHIWRRIRYEPTTNRWFETLDTIRDTVQRTTRAWSPQKLRQLCNVT